jgi:hypothetical protein
MISDRDIWAAALLMCKRYGDDADNQATARANILRYLARRDLHDLDGRANHVRWPLLTLRTFGHSDPLSAGAEL